MIADALKRAAAERAAGLVRDGMKLGLGTGSTAAAFVSLLAGRVRAGLTVVGVATSERTRDQAEREGVPLATLDELDDELRLIKGGGGALLREKIVAAASRRMIVIADGAKRVDRLGRFPLPIEVVPFGLAATRAAVRKAIREAGSEGELRLRTAPSGQPFLTDGGHCILDAALGRIDAPERLAAALAATPGVVEHGLFLGLASGAILATESGLVELGRV